ncbi:MAG: succinylglutamate desuccinylase/aspartoacylase family protein [Acetatifactor sp.]|nr:succinylglutamate desuccinylase/aspartoacylase family protein [Acetatifactor sp.]
MVDTIISLELPVGEHLTIKRNRICYGEEKKNMGRVAVVSGTHGDELEGQYICYEVARRLAEHPECLTGIVDIYPALNPLGIDLASKALPITGMDMNRMFPGSRKGNAMEQIAAAVVDDLIGADLCIDVHSSDIFVQEIPQVRLSEEFAERMLPFAKLMNVDVIWMNATATVHEATLAHSMNLMGVPTMVVELGQGNSINMTYGNQVVDGIFNVMHEMGLWTGEVPSAQLPAISSDGKVEFIRSEMEGIFLPRSKHNHFVCVGELIGEIVDPMTGQLKRRITAGKDGLLFSLRNYPVVYEGDLLARILTGIE